MDVSMEENEKTECLKIVIDTNLDNGITEGQATIRGEGKVFYNPVQQFNRDLSIVVISTFFRKFYQPERVKKTFNIPITDPPEPGNKYDEGMTILEALSATGLRSIRYAKEVPGICKIIANDLSRQAVAAINENIKNNGVADLVFSENMDAMTLMYLSTRYEKRFNVIDLDPYGCPGHFLDGAMQSIKDGGLLLITATDMAVLAGNTPETCYVKYGTMPLKTKACHEMALRILLKCIESHATRYGRFIKPLISISADFYIRVFLRVFTSPQECKRSTSKQSMVYQCAGCDSMTFHPLGIIKSNPTEKNPKQIKYCTGVGPPVNINCEFCRHRHHIGGPIWTAPIHDFEFVADALETAQSDKFSYLATLRRIVGMLTVVEEELPDIPLYYTVENLCSTLKLEIVPILKFRSALLNAGYRVSFSHACKSSIKTDAPTSVLWDILRCWSKIHPVKPERFIDGTPLKEILSKESPVDYQFDEIHPDANPRSRRESLARFPENPTSHWGPGTRSTLGETKDPKNIRNQNKHKNKMKRSEILRDEDGANERKHKNLKLDCDL